jgi:hypothetical protein
MAIEGTKIIDGDLSRDTYNGIMDLYDSDASIEIIRKEIPFVKTDFGSETDFYHEIFVTAYALAFWEIGELTNEILTEVKNVISVAAGVNCWTEKSGKTEGKKRQKELDKLLEKISQSNYKIRKRKKYRLISKLYFQPDDILAFQLPDKNYYAVVCVKVTQQRGNCTYDLVATTYKSKVKPIPADFHNCFIAGRIISSGFDEMITLSYQPDIEEIWKYYKSATNYFFGLPYHLVTHKDIIGFKDKIETVGKLKIKESFKREGSYVYESGFDRFESIFSDLESYMKVNGEEKFPVTLLCEI